MIGAGIGIALLGIIPLICKVAAEKERVRQRRAQEESRYNGEVKKYNDAVANDKRRVSMELKQKERLIVERNELERQLNASKALLVTYYEQSGINNRFCNLIAVGYMYEYIEIGISNKLEGVDGLYNLILQKLEWNKLHHTLEEISSKLDVIIDNQRLMYQELVSMNSKCEGILDELYTLSAKVDENTTVQNQIMDNTAASAYYAERAARAGEYSNYMTAWNNIRE